MLNFTVGPVQLNQEVRDIGAENIPYFRTPEFSAVMLENEQLMLEFLNAPSGSRCVFLTSSGTGAMESCVMNILNGSDKIILINGGSFGRRFGDLCCLHERDFSEIKVDFGKQLRSEQLYEYSEKGYTALLVNMHETSSGVLYDMPMISQFCRENGILLIVDAISAFLADELDMSSLGATAVITGSQKALAVPPGVSVITLSPEALERVESNKEICMYLSLKEALKNGERGQTPFTPAVGILLQINKRLKQIEQAGGTRAEGKRIAALAADFRSRIRTLPLDIFSDSLSNAVTPLATRNCCAYDIFTMLKDRYQIWVCPNGGELRDKVFRVGHLGDLTVDDNVILADALYDLVRQKIIQ